jgi:hypothetical protein
VPLQIAGAVALDAMTQRQVLRARRRADRIGLHVFERLERALQRGWRKELRATAKRRRSGQTYVTT